MFYILCNYYKDPIIESLDCISLLILTKSNRVHYPELASMKGDFWSACSYWQSGSNGS